jgi:ABC-type polysaccharide/polyol phosphate export permease
VALFRMPLCEGRIPDLTSCAMAVAAAAGALLIGWIVFTARADALASRL